MRRSLSLSDKNVMVTGGAGFIGSHLSDRLLHLGVSGLTIVDDFSLGKRRNIATLVRDPRTRVYRRDATDFAKLQKIMEKERVDVVFNLAVVPLPMSLELPRETVVTNVALTTNVCDLLRKGKFETLVHCSSSEAYGTALYVPMDENHPEKPLTPYAASKIACDHIVFSYFRTFGIDASIARPFNAYGPRQNERSYAGVIPLTIGKILRGEPPEIFGDGQQTRDYSYVGDIVKGIIGVYKSPKARGEMINIASGKEVAIRTLIEKICRLMKYEGEIVHKPARPGDVLRHRGDISLAERLIGYRPETSFEEGLEKTIEWYRKEIKGTT